GVDVRGVGGNIVVAPSIHPSGNLYKWLVYPVQTPPQPLPGFLLDILRPKKADPAPGQPIHRNGYIEPTGDVPTPNQLLDLALRRPQPEGRNETGFWLACQLRDCGYTQSEAKRTMDDYQATVGNTSTHPYTEQEAAKSLASAYAQTKRDAWVLNVNGNGAHIPDEPPPGVGNQWDIMQSWSVAEDPPWPTDEVTWGGTETPTSPPAQGRPDILSEFVERALNGEIPTPNTPEPPAFDPMPALPAHLRRDDLAAGASPWLDAYCEFSRRWSPRGFDDYHEAVGLWVLSTVAARRLVLDFGRKRYTGLYVAQVGRTSIYAKTTTAYIGATALREAGLKHLLAPDDSTPQAFVKGMAMRYKVPDGWDLLPEDEQKRLLLRLEFPAQRGWFYDELGQKISAMMRDGGHMADFRGLLRRLDDAPESYEYESIARGSEFVERPYLAMLGNITPADLAPYAGAGGPLWGDGFWARWAFVAPAADEAPNLEGRFPDGALSIPAEIVNPLRRLHERLGIPKIELQPIVDDKGKTTGWQVQREDPPPARVRVADGVFDAFYGYHDALLQLAFEGGNQDLDGNYTRFAEKALRVSVLLAALEGDVIEMRHWARAQQVTERWRAGLHNLYAQVTGNLGAETERRVEGKVVELLKERGALTKRELCQYAHVQSEAMGTILSTLVESGFVTMTQSGRTYHFLLAQV
ncbi:MAG: DUF3987 domain-containing protein, partial [Chloroflexi bacterium]|nr:DUF3987 domain-containing protein [Chloroflexota bacterium]